MWQTVNLGDVCIISSSKRIFAKEYQTEGIPFYRGKEVIEKHNGNNVSTELFISPERYEEIKRKYVVPKKGDILLTSVGTLGVPWIVDEEDFYFKDGNLTWLRCNTEILPGYLYLWLNSAEAKNQIDAKCIGSTQKALTIETLNKFQITLPSLELQKKIVSVINPIESKIKSNRKINENLTDQAQAIYQQHFVTKANPDWPLGHLSDLINVKYGKDHKKLADGAYPVYGSGGIMRYVEHPLYEKESVLIPRKGTLNNVMYVNQPFWSVDTMFYTEMKQANVAKFVYHYVKSKDLASMNAGSAVPSMTTAILNAMELRIPSEEALFQFENSVAPMYEMIKKNEDQSRKLAQLRDVLLSKLMSGEIDVSNLDL